MSDIVERLRETIVAYDEWYQGQLKTSDTLLERFSRERHEAADEILRLRAHNEKILDGMRDIIRERDILSGENYDLRAEIEKLKKELDFAIKGVEKYEAIIDTAKEQAKDELSKKLREANGYLFRDWKENARLMWQAAEKIEKLRKALTAILNDAGYHNPMRMTTEISDKILEDAAGALHDYI